MKKTLNNCLLIIMLIFFFRGNLFSTHIVGGSLTYTYNGSNNYKVELKLYRDCAGTSFPASVIITVLQANGNLFSPSRNFSMAGGAVTNIPSVLSPCTTSSVTPCVEERVYTTTVNLLPLPGGMHLYTSQCCRNGSILNINFPSGNGQTYYCYIPSYEEIWKEDFALPNGTTTDVGATAWTRTLGVNPPASAQVNNNEFEIIGASNGSVTWASQSIPISTFTNGVNLSVNARRTGAMQNGDSLKIYYSLNGGPKMLFPVNGNLPGAFATPAFAIATGLAGNSIQIYVRAVFNATTTSAKYYDVDMVTVYDNTFVPNSSPSITNSPPLFLCASNSFTLNHSATDVDGDQLVYSMYTPYTDAPAPTFPNNAPAIATVTWVPNYSATSPFNSPSPAVSINSVTGVMSGVANSTGQFVFGVKVREYRGGILLSEVVRDYQVNVVTCATITPPPAPLTSANSPVCSGSTLSLTASFIAGATYSWIGPNSFSSTSQNPIIAPTTSLSAGNYSVHANISGCAGATGTVSVVVNPVPTLSVVSGNTMVCSGTSANLFASGALTYTWNTSANTASINVIPTTSTIYTVSGTNILNCSASATTMVNVNSNCSDVWPGDANSDGMSNNIDVFELGINYLQTGPARSIVSNSWTPYFANNWSGSTSTSKNLAHSDCNGDGIINFSDTLAIYNNYNQLHTFQPVTVQSSTLDLNIYPDQAFIATGQWGTSSIYLGDTIHLLSNIYGVAFDITYDNTLIQTDSIYIEYINSFLNAGTSNILLRKRDFGNGLLYTASVRTDFNDVNGFGKIAVLHYKAKANITSNSVLNIALVNGKKTNSSGNIVLLTSGTTSITITPLSTGINEFALSQIKVYPNPAGNSLFVELSTIQNATFRLIDPIGQEVYSQKLYYGNNVIYTAVLAPGIYHYQVCVPSQQVQAGKIVLQK